MIGSQQTTPMPMVTLGRTGIVTSRLSVGTWGFGDASALAAKVPDENIAGILTTAFKAGVRFIDSAEVYDNEAKLGRLLQQIDTPPDLVIATKFGHGKGFSGAQFRRSVEDSLGNLGLEKIELMMVHDPRTADDMAIVMGPGGALEELRKMQDEGIVGSIGIATGTFTPLRMAVDSGEFDCIQFPRLFTLLNLTARSTRLLADAKAKNMGTLNPSPFGGSILATGTKPGALYAFRAALPEVMEAVGNMEARCAELGVTLPAAALAWSLTEPLVDITIVGVVNTQELSWDLDALRVTLSRDDLESIAAAGTIDPRLLGGPEFLRSFPDDRELPPMRRTI
jgi:D-threo-aldose 1-dehydrogenase